MKETVKRRFKLIRFLYSDADHMKSIETVGRERALFGFDISFRTMKSELEKDISTDRG
jgi:hypothetical protein